MEMKQREDELIKRYRPKYNRYQKAIYRPVRLRRPNRDRLPLLTAVATEQGWVLRDCQSQSHP
jgi:hypothetical protein